MSASEKSIIFSAPMIRAILEGRKTMTRRIVKVQPPAEATSAGNYANSLQGATRHWSWVSGDPRDCDTWEERGDFRLRYVPGDFLWVKETALYWIRNSDNKRDKVAAFAADLYELKPGERWTPSIHMPRWASRITLRVTAVKVERLQEISKADALAEGIYKVGGGILRWEKYQAADGLPDYMTAEAAFAALWQSIHGPGSWDANPFVAAYSFERVKP